MSPQGHRDLPASVKQRLLNLAKKRGEDFNFLLTRFAVERLLYRIDRSKYGGDFILKGAMLFHLASKQQPHRATRDVDLLGKGASNLARWERIFREITQVAVEDDGVAFLDKSVRAERIREEDEYAGVRLRVEARLGSARIPLQVDVGLGDAPIPPPQRTALATLLEFPAPRLLIYPWETVIAEKFQILVDRGIANSRMKDYFDLHHLAHAQSFDGDSLSQALRATFQRRRMSLPAEVPMGLTDAFAEDAAKRTQWRAFIRRLGLDESKLALMDVLVVLRGFLMPPVDTLRQGEKFVKQWPPGGPWR